MIKHRNHAPRNLFKWPKTKKLKIGGDLWNKNDNLQVQGAVKTNSKMLIWGWEYVFIALYYRFRENFQKIGLKPVLFAPVYILWFLFNIHGKLSVVRCYTWLTYTIHDFSVYLRTGSNPAEWILISFEAILENIFWLINL